MNATQQKINDTIYNLTFGIEIETVGRSRNFVATALADLFNTFPRHEGGCYDKWTVAMNDGRKWSIMSDGSVNNVNGIRGGAEVVSPILRLADMDAVQEVVRAVRRSGARVDYSCGIHIHIGANAFDAKALRNLVVLTAAHEEHFHKAIGTSGSRLTTWCKPISQRVLDGVANLKGRNLTLDAIRGIWYGTDSMYPTREHYNRTRYASLNLHNVWFRGTVEFRSFDATLHAGEIRAYVMLCLCLSAKAIVSRACKVRRVRYVASTSRYDTRVWLLNLGMIGDEYKNVRKHLLKNTSGDASVQNGRMQRAA